MTISQKRKQWYKHGVTIFLFLLPALVVYFTYTMAGIVRTFYYSGFNWSGIGPAASAEFVGLGNYLRLMGDSGFWHALQNNILLVIVSIVFQLGFGMILALMLNTGYRGVKALRTVYFMSLLLSTVATGPFGSWSLLPLPGFLTGYSNVSVPMYRFPGWDRNKRLCSRFFL
jgi:raffinose/stachyose/melibiose transport system permease protein